VYSKEAMQQYLKGTRGAKRCPVVGACHVLVRCGSIVLIPRITLGCAQNVTEMQLEPDLDLERRIERAKKNNKRRDAVNANVVDL
jgi:hypothetical protein